MLQTANESLNLGKVTSLDPLESTPQTASKPLKNKQIIYDPRWNPSGFSLNPESCTAPKTGAAPKRITIPEPETPIKQRASIPSNYLTGIEFRHNTWRGDRQNVIDVLMNDGRGSAAYWSMKQCGTMPIVYRNPEDPSRYKVCCQRCHHRFCVPCAQDRARLIVANMHDQVKHEPTRLLTLTLKHSDDPLKKQLDRLYDAFGKLRRRALWKGLVTGGLAFTEIKLSSGDSRWHPHLHVLIRGKYVPQGALSDEWLNITGDSFIVDVKMVKHEAGVYRYLTKYVTKGWGSGLYRNKDRLIEAIDALKGRKVVIAFGSMAKVNLLKPPEPEIWDLIGTLKELIDRADSGDEEAKHALAHIHGRDYIPALTDVPDD